MSDLADQIDALLALNAKGAVSHPVPGLAVELLTKAAEALRALEKGEAKPVIWMEFNNKDGFTGLRRWTRDPEQAARWKAEPDAGRFEEYYAAPVPVRITERPEIGTEREILERLAAGDEIAYSQDGDDAFFTKGDRAFVGPAIIDMRSKGYLKRIVLDPENYRGGAERDVISDAGRAALSQKPGEQG